MKTLVSCCCLCLIAVLCTAQNISSYSIITTGSVFKSGKKGGVVLTQPMYEKLFVEQSALNTQKPVKLASVVKVHPNPFREEVKLTANMEEGGMMQVNVYNMIGAKVWEGVAMSFSAGINERTIALEGLKAGVYFLKTSRDKENTESIIKLIKQ